MQSDLYFIISFYIEKYEANAKVYYSPTPKSLLISHHGNLRHCYNIAFTSEMFQLCFSSYKQKSLDIFVYQGFCCLKKWCHQESNRGYMDLQSIALPTELWHLLFGLQIYISILTKQTLY